MITVSIVSHNHGEMVVNLVNSLLEFNEITKIIITYNIDEPLKFSNTNRILALVNKNSLGFGENHNNAFELCKSRFFCVLNPDIIFLDNPFNKILTYDKLKLENSIIAPLVFDKNNKLEDSARNFPTFKSLIKKLLFNNKDLALITTTKIQYSHYKVDWVAGMFMLFSSETYRRLKGFNTKYFLYYEDVDICKRALNLKIDVIVLSDVKIIHDANRKSHKNILYTYFHLKSLVRYFITGFKKGQLDE